MTRMNYDKNELRQEWTTTRTNYDKNELQQQWTTTTMNIVTDSIFWQPVKCRQWKWHLSPTYDSWRGRKIDYIHKLAKCTHYSPIDTFIKLLALLNLIIRPLYLISPGGNWQKLNKNSEFPMAINQHLVKSI